LSEREPTPMALAAEAISTLTGRRELSSSGLRWPDRGCGRRRGGGGQRSP